MRRFFSRLRHLWHYRGEYALLDRQRKVIANTLAAPPPAQVSAPHLAILRNLRVTWGLVESGAPSLRQSSPFGYQRSTRRTGLEILGIRDEALLAKTLVEVGQMIPVWCANAMLLPGHYQVPEDMRAYFDAPGTGVSHNGEFDFRSEHAVLLRHFNWRFDMLNPPCWPLPCIDGKRPYGDCSHFQIDMASHLGKPYIAQQEEEVFLGSDCDTELENLHYQMLAALQVFLCHAKLSDRSITEMPEQNKKPAMPGRHAGLS